jgi:hypothetical protein
VVFRLRDQPDLRFRRNGVRRTSRRAARRSGRFHFELIGCTGGAWRLPSEPRHSLNSFAFPLPPPHVKELFGQRPSQHLGIPSDSTELISRPKITYVACDLISIVRVDQELRARYGKHLFQISQPVGQLFRPRTTRWLGWASAETDIVTCAREAHDQHPWSSSGWGRGIHRHRRCQERSSESSRGKWQRCTSELVARGNYCRVNIVGFILPPPFFWRKICSNRMTSNARSGLPKPTSLGGSWPANYQHRRSRPRINC